MGVARIQDLREKFVMVTVTGGGLVRVPGIGFRGSCNGDIMDTDIGGGS